LVRVNVYVFMLQALAAIVRAVTGLPVWVLGLRPGPLALVGPLRTRSFDFLEVAVWVALDVLLVVEHLLVPRRVFFALLFVGRHRGRSAGLIV